MAAKITLRLDDAELREIIENHINDNEDYGSFSLLELEFVVEPQTAEELVGSAHNPAAPARVRIAAVVTLDK